MALPSQKRFSWIFKVARMFLARNGRPCREIVRLFGAMFSVGRSRGRIWRLVHQEGVDPVGHLGVEGMASAKPFLLGELDRGLGAAGKGEDDPDRGRLVDRRGEIHRSTHLVRPSPGSRKHP